MRKIEHITITGLIEALSGIRIGGSDDLLQIGGTDLTCIKHPVTLQPYLPGSSLKGKMRSEIEKAFGKFSGRFSDEPCGCKLPNCPVCRVFGPHKQARHELGPTRLIVRDALLVSGGETELKSENVIDRRTGTAQHPRKVERVVAGSTFALTIGVQVWDIDDNFIFQNEKGGAALVKVVRFGLTLMEQTGLGSGVGKGSGQIKLTGLKRQEAKMMDLTLLEIPAA